MQLWPFPHLPGRSRNAVEPRSTVPLPVGAQFVAALVVGLHLLFDEFAGRNVPGLGPLVSDQRHAQVFRRRYRERPFVDGSMDESETDAEIVEYQPFDEHHLVRLDRENAGMTRPLDLY